MSIGEDELEVGPSDPGDSEDNAEDMDITFDDAPAQVKPTVEALKAATLPKPRKTRKPKVAKTTPAPKAKHRVETIDNNKLAAYLDKIVNEEGYKLISVSGSSSIMGAFTIVSVKVA